MWPSLARLDDLVGVSVGVVHRRTVVGPRRHVVAALLVLDALLFGFVFHRRLQTVPLSRLSSDQVERIGFVPQPRVRLVGRYYSALGTDTADRLCRAINTEKNMRALNVITH